MDKNALAHQLLLTFRVDATNDVKDLALIIKNRLSNNTSPEDNEVWDQKIRGVCAYLRKLKFIKYNGFQIKLTKKGTEYLNLMYAPIAIDKKEDKESCN